MAGRGRPAGFLMDDRQRVKIQNSNILHRLLQYAEGELELDSGRVRAIEILLKKVLPDLSAVTHSGDQDNPIKHEISADDAFARLASRLAGAAPGTKGGTDSAE